MGNRVELETGRLAWQPANGTPAHLTLRQLEVLALLCEGLPNKLIARRLNISSATVKIHVANILRELNVTSRLQAVIAVRRRGLIAEPASGEMAQPERAPELRQPITLRIVWNDISAQWQAAPANEPLTRAAV